MPPSSPFPPAFIPYLPHPPSLRRTSFIPLSTLHPRLSPPRRPHSPPSHSITSSQQPTDPPDPPPNNNNPDYWLLALEDLFLEALRAYYQGTPIFSDSEFETLRDELEHLASANLRLATIEQIWVQATNARDFDRRVKDEFQLSQQDLDRIKNKLLTTGAVKRPTITAREPPDFPPPPAPRTTVKPRPRMSRLMGRRRWPLWKDAEKIDANAQVDQRLKWLLFSDASEERLKILLLYLPAVLMSFVTASVLTILFALLDGEMRIDITNTGRVRLGILSYLVVMLTVWFSNQVTPVMLDYLDLGQPTLIRGDCPICGAPVSCLFTGAARIRDERKCSVCNSIVGFNRKWCKVYLVSPPGSKRQQPD